MLKVLTSAERQQMAGTEKRRGAIMVLSVFFLAGILVFIGMSVDLGMVNVTKTKMQACADSCALAAAQEIVAAIQAAGASGSEVEVDDVHLYAEQQARAIAKDIASRNGFLLLDDDIDFGRRSWSNQSQSFEIDWAGSPYNAVQVTVRRDGDDPTKADGKLPLLFAPAFGNESVALQTQASAYVEARDFVTILDYSRSMNFDSLPYYSSLNSGDVQNNLDNIYDELAASGAYYSDDSSTLKFPAGGWGEIDSYAGTYVYDSDKDDIYDALDLESDSDEGVRSYDYDNYSGYKGKFGPGTYNLSHYSGMNQDINSFRVPSGFTITLRDYTDGTGWQFGPVSSDVSSMGSYNNDASWMEITSNSTDDWYIPFPQEGRTGVDGNLKGKPSRSQSRALWKDYIQWVIWNSNDGSSSLLRISSSRDYRYDFGYRTLMMYLLDQHCANHESEDLWRVSAYPFKAVKDGMTQFNTFLTDLSFGDTLGLVDYATTARKQNTIFGNDVSSPNTVSDVNLGSDYLTSDYHKIETIQFHHQGAHYSSSTNIGDGVKKAREILASEGRAGARWQMLVMTDGVVNQPSSLPSGLPSGWNSFDWDNLTDWDNDGVANYDNSDITSGSYANQKRYLFYQTKLAVEAGITVHTMAVGNGADTNIMRAVATMGNGVYIQIPGTATAEQMATLLEEKFNLLAGNVPPAKLLHATE